ncbi:hypothetical protein ASG01_14220 [Chryseobacterium sp. Leaf180]|uniref:DNA adenine methylase n=1 Tax=Chryseobacterium sp. Leaf180 TaxID=1736289 RepID=UPI0006FB9DFD|nr:Dam family site-specific DNA-(adenine-N6)-methyltransferase [Chryseobacterium sp. Leaf180]KQR91518.1 hypothetical protein ASG01_14220 [Chryseobacterium sp. Leaf180]
MIDTQEIDMKTVQPFLRWAGGKRWLTKRLIDFVPKSYNNYHEVFLGGGAVFFYLKPSNHIFLNDLNAELINAYNIIKNCHGDLLQVLETLINNEESYYKIRDFQTEDNLLMAARFIYLNKTCYNGIYRVNSLGKFNVPYGKNESIQIFCKNNISAVSKSLTNARLSSHDFESCINNIEKRDLVFLDPPYTVAHNNNGFIEYNQKIFSWEDQLRLAEFVNEIDKKGAFYILTNAMHDSIRNLYKNVGKKYEMERHSTIASNLNNRKKISEYIVTNCIS